MATRRNRPSYEPDRLLGVALSTPLLWPGRTVRLERDSLLDCRGRGASAHISVAELYHENSKLSPRHLPELVHGAVDATAFRREYLRRRALVARATGREDPPDAAPWRELLDGAAAEDPDLLYAIEPRLLVHDGVYAHEPSAPFRLVRRLAPADLDGLFAALALLAPVPDRSGAQVFLVGCFARNEILLGPRGYRRTLVEAGQVAAGIARHARRLGRDPVVRREFSDRDVDRVMEVDGVEHSVVVAVGLT
jgi:hypothetical protein